MKNHIFLLYHNPAYATIAMQKTKLSLPPLRNVPYLKKSRQKRNKYKTKLQIKDHHMEGI